MINWRFWFTCAFWAFVIWWVVENPHQAGLFIHGLGGFAAHAAHSLSIMMASI